ncbi:MAG: 2,3-bisphosphoglycerate-independent phosphoglycerate mutase [Sulfuricella sp.]|nr:2,3-bisphosphoglycerate-independent phosphoglycerate mutase [Sulfuricella sp.]
MKVTPVLLIILDGFGYRPNGADNAIALANMPFWNQLWRDCPHTLIHTSAGEVGLPDGQMGNSEVGHLNIGAGRVVYQELTRINRSIASGEFFSNAALTMAVNTALKNDSALHVFGLLSDGGVHSQETHIHAMLDMAAKAGVSKLYLHAFLDGRDTPPQSAEGYLKNAEAKFAQLGVGRIATIGGRYYVMDRDKRWDRVKVAYDMMTTGRAEFSAPDAVSGLQAAYARGENDEFVKPTLIGEAVRIQDDDVVVFMNFRADRAREITRAFIEPDFAEFERAVYPKLATYCTLTSYNKNFHVPVAFPPDSVHNGFGDVVSSLGLHQLRIAETEKYAHVTFFFNGGVEAPVAGEDRILVQSPHVATYDLQPEMSAREVTDKLVEAIESKKYAAIVCNYANGDMVGHTGILPAAVRAVEVLDECLSRVVPAMQAVGGEVLITADHGNAEKMLDEVTGAPHTAHTTFDVPFLYVGRPATLKDGGALKNVAPTLLKMMGLPQPPEMSGEPLIEFK